MDANDDLSPPDVELDEYGIPVQPPPARPIREFVFAACGLVCAAAQPLMLFGYLGKYTHLRLELRLEAMAVGLAGILPWFWLKQFLPAERRRGVWVPILIVMFLGAGCAVMLFFAGLFGQICHHNCGSGGY